MHSDFGVFIIISIPVRLIVITTILDNTDKRILINFPLFNIRVKFESVFRLEIELCCISDESWWMFISSLPRPARMFVKWSCHFLDLFWLKVNPNKRSRSNERLIPFLSPIWTGMQTVKHINCQYNFTKLLSPDAKRIIDVARFFMSNLFIRNQHVEDQKCKELFLPNKKSLRTFSISNIFITANNRELGSWFHLLQSNLHGLCVNHVASVS